MRARAGGKTDRALHIKEQMLPSSQHEADERIARYLGRLAAGTAGRKAQYFLECIAAAWGPELLSCLGGTKWHVGASELDVATVAAEAGRDRPTRVRVAALAALAQAGEHAP